MTLYQVATLAAGFALAVSFFATLQLVIERAIVNAMRRLEREGPEGSCWPKEGE